MKNKFFKRVTVLSSLCLIILSTTAFADTLLMSYDVVSANSMDSKDSFTLKSETYLNINHNTTKWFVDGPYDQTGTLDISVLKKGGILGMFSPTDYRFSVKGVDSYKQRYRLPEGTYKLRFKAQSSNAEARFNGTVKGE